MLRLFEEHCRREVLSLDGAWNFCIDPTNVGTNDAWYCGIPNGHTVVVPSVWNTERGLLTYEGVAWYEKSFHTVGGVLRFCFGAVMTEATVYLDGKEIGSHYGGFSQFDCIVPDVKAGMHRLILRLDNRFDEHSIPQKKVDWYHYGGVIRSVSVEILKGICVLSDRLEYTLSQDRTEAHCRPVVELYNADKQKGSTHLSLYVDGEIHSFMTAEVCGEQSVTVEMPDFTLSGIRLWDIGTPNLYSLTYLTDTDDLCDRVGFRHITADGTRILLNGKPIEIRGVNRHEEAPEWGFAFPTGLMKRDLDLITEMGCNAIRGSHYPNSQAFLDWVDESGLLFWSEIPIWGCGFSVESLADPIVVQRGLDMHREMVKYYCNHPSIVIWGMHNEICSNTAEALQMTRTYYDFLKKNGGNRLVVYASHLPMEDICMEFCDVICINQYYGWYYGYEEDAWETFLEKFACRRKEIGVAQKPIIMSEFGSAAIAGYHDDAGILWSEENQAKQLEHCLEVFHADPAIAGSFIWQFCDIRTCLEAGINRARGFNNKGLMNEYRKPKLSYYVAQKCYRRFASEEAKHADE